LFDYGGKVKAIDPNAILLHGGMGLAWLSLQRASMAMGRREQRLQSAPFPRPQHERRLGYGPWLLNQHGNYELTNGLRLLDVFTLHIYPQGANEWGSDVLHRYGHWAATAPPARFGTRTT